MSIGRLSFKRRTPIALVAFALASGGACKGPRVEPSTNGDGGESPGAGAASGGETEGGSGGTSTPAGAGGSGAVGGSGFAGYPNTGAVPGKSCRDASAALATCDLVTGAVDCGKADDDPNAPCHYGCYALATCAELTDALCHSALNHFASCLARCQEFRCDDGTPLLSSWWCDGVPDCDDGEDEVGCPPPATCSDGSGLSPAWICDGFPDCPDGGDEVGCSFECASGDTIAAEGLCDGSSNCADGSDEEACAELTCGGTRIRL